MTFDVDIRKLPDISKFSGLLSDRVYLAMRSAILSMDFKPGQIIRKAPLCAYMGISRSPVADAIQKLSGEGLVDVVPQSTTRVTKLSIEDIRESAFLREALELASVARAVQFRTNDQLAQLSRNLRIQAMLVEDNDLNELYRYDAEFHEILMDCSGIMSLQPTVEAVSLQVNRARALLLPEPGRSEETVKEHRQIYEAIKERDASAAQAALKSHLGQLILRLEPLQQSRPELFETAKTKKRIVHESQ